MILRNCQLRGSIHLLCSTVVRLTGAPLLTRRSSLLSQYGDSMVFTLCIVQPNPDIFLTHGHITWTMNKNINHGSFRKGRRVIHQFRIASRRVDRADNSKCRSVFYARRQSVTNFGHNVRAMPHHIYRFLWITEPSIHIHIPWVYLCGLPNPKHFVTHNSAALMVVMTASSWIICNNSCKILFLYYTHIENSMKMRNSIRARRVKNVKMRACYIVMWRALSCPERLWCPWHMPTESSR